MNAVWKVTHDPLRLTAPGVTAARLEADAREQGEDIVQAECVSPKEKKVTADLGWYRDRYIVFLVEAPNWESPLERFECSDLESAMAVFHKLAPQ